MTVSRGCRGIDPPARRRDEYKTVARGNLRENVCSDCHSIHPRGVVGFGMDGEGLGVADVPVCRCALSLAVLTRNLARVLFEVQIPK